MMPDVNWPECTVIPMNASLLQEMGRWVYPPPYDWYNMTGSDEETREFLDGSYFAVIDGRRHVVGFCCTGAAAQVPLGVPAGAYPDDGALDIGLGMRPELTGQARGRDFWSTLLGFFTNQFGAISLRLTVATFNARAIQLYHRVGFVGRHEFTAHDVTFLVMYRRSDT